MSAGTLIIGLGNPILGDDGVGWRVAQEVRRQIFTPSPLRFGVRGLQSLISKERLEIRDCEVDCVSLGGLSLMERMIGYDRAIVIDAIATARQPIGSVSRFALEDLPDRMAGHTTAAHDTSLQTALKVGRALGAHLPDRVTIVAIETGNVYDFSETLTPPVVAAIPRAAEMVLEALGAHTQ